ncbi:c-type cytochrome [Microvirga brassicacearum]|uniref:Cytochrome c n=1 Tax=Microvirga brassicacearum TaxID=2580413 RepID=A0A5N3PCF4_9HYPH|nr:cytochrome c [Microvirga brassicacearum]KAB0267428.1 cytochrome c [Microvirga brassicacearum]
MRVIFTLAAALFLSGCDSGTEERTEVASTRVVQRPFVPVPTGVVPRGAAARAAALAAPGPQVGSELVERGAERHIVFCAPCHGADGGGNGTVASRGFLQSSSYFEEQLRALSPAQIVMVITQGKGRMFSFADAVPPEDRWAIAHYVKDLQARTPTPSPPPRQRTP